MTGSWRIPLAVVSTCGMLFLVGPLLVVVIASFTAGSIVAFPPQAWGVRWYAVAAGRLDFLRALLVTLGLAFAVTAICLVPGLLTALAIVRGRFRGRRWLGMAALSPLFVPSVVIGFAALPVVASLGLLGSLWAVVIVYIVLVFPGIVRALVGTLEGLDGSIEEAAMVFGASPARAFLTITLPRAGRGILAAAIFACVVVFDEAVIINFIGGTGTPTFPQRLFSYISESDDPLASVYATGMIVATTFTMLAIDRLVGFERLR